MTDPRPPFVESLFAGEIHEDLVFPWPRMPSGERDRVKTLVSDLRDLTDREYDPRRAESDGWIGDDVVRALGERGLLGLYVDEQYGGQGLGAMAYARIFEELGSIDAALGFVVGVHQSLGMRGIHQFGTPEQKGRFLPDLVRGRRLAGFALTEPGSGSDVVHLETRARRQADNSWLLDGEKRWIGNGSKDVLVTVARSDENEHVLLIVEKGMDGFQVGPRHRTMGLHANDLRSLSFDGVRIPPENVLGTPSEGHDMMMKILAHGRMSMAAGCLGGSRRALDLALEHVESRRQFGRALADFELVGMKLGWMICRLYGLESGVYLAAGMADAGRVDLALESALVKVAATEHLWYAANRAFQLAGGMAYMADQPYEKMLRDARINPIVEGANDVLRLHIGLTGLERLGRELEDLQDLDLSEPVRSLGAVAGYARDRVRMELRSERLSRHHSDLSSAADAVGDQVKGLRLAGEGLLREHGRGVIERQGQVTRLAEVASDLFLQTAVVARASAWMEDAGPVERRDERAIAERFLERAAQRADGTLEAVGANDDEALTSIARSACGGGGYGCVLDSLSLTGAGGA